MKILKNIELEIFSCLVYQYPNGYGCWLIKDNAILVEATDPSLGKAIDDFRGLLAGVWGSLNQPASYMRKQMEDLSKSPKWLKSILPQFKLERLTDLLESSLVDLQVVSDQLSQAEQEISQLQNELRDLTKTLVKRK